MAVVSLLTLCSFVSRGGMWRQAFERAARVGGIYAFEACMQQTDSPTVERCQVGADVLATPLIQQSALQHSVPQL